MTVSCFDHVEEFALDEAFSLTAQFNADTNPDKVSLGAGVYRDEAGQPWRLPSVIEAKRRLDTPNQYHEYLPIHGSDSFLDPARDLVFGPDSAVRENRIASVQTISGTGANNLGASFLAHHLKPQNVWIPDPTWGNHHLIWTVAAPAVKRKAYPHYSQETGEFHIEGMVNLLRQEAKQNDVILLHGCAHNPTGVDPTKEQWKVIADLVEEKQLFVFFDNAYQGFATGSLDDDAWSVRHFTSRGLELLVCQSFAKNMGLYGERVGALHLAVSSTTRANVLSQLVRLQRSGISTPPLFGSRIVALILSTPDLYELWQKDLNTMSSRVKQMRQALYNELLKLGTPGRWGHIVDQIGMFSYTGLSAEQVQLMASRHHVYLMKSGRASISGLTENNVGYVAKAIHDVVTRPEAKEAASQT